jgi:hypothetical protein
MTSYDSTQRCGRPRIARGVGPSGGVIAVLLLLRRIERLRISF